MLDSDDTIAAMGTAAGGGARGMVRVAGPRAIDVVAGVFTPTEASAVPAEVRAASVLPGAIRLASEPPLTLDCDLFVWPNERSYTRGPLVELHLLGSPPLLQAVLDEVCRHGARLAGPGEFTLRAFLAGRIDLTQAEAVLGVIDARGDADLKTALRQLAGGLSGPLDQLRNQLLDLLAHLEAGLDFAEEDIEFITAEELASQLATAETLLADIAAQLAGRDEATDAVRIVLVGEPNVGKSSLYNALLRHARPSGERAAAQALVSPIAGTTRDYLAARFVVDGHPCELIDTAGWEDPIPPTAPEAADGIDAAAQRHGQANRQAARLVLLCFDAARPLTGRERASLAAADAHSIVVCTKADLPAAISPPADAVLTSAEQQRGIDRLWQAIAQRLSAIDEQHTGGVATTAARCRESLRLANAAIGRAGGLAAGGGQEELVASELRVALNELGQVVGAVYTDDILDRVFSRFCIGK